MSTLSRKTFLTIKQLQAQDPRNQCKNLHDFIKSYDIPFDSQDNSWVATLGSPVKPDFIVRGGFVEDCIDALADILEVDFFNYDGIASECDRHGFADGGLWGVIHGNILDSWADKQGITLKWL